MYQLLRKVLFLFDAEQVHHFAMNTLRLCNSLGLKRIISLQFTQKNSGLHTELFGLTFRNPVGLAAGFDKNALYLDELEALGFGFVEIGTVTPMPQAGNEKPRLFRLPKDKALINRMGFNNDGVKLVAERLRHWKAKDINQRHQLIIGGNIGKNKFTPNEEAWKDYEICYRELFDYIDYFVINVSSPNTPGLRQLQEKESLRKILSHLQTINNAKLHPKPLLLKIAPDLTQHQLDEVIDLALEIKLDGLVATNTTIDRDGLVTKKEAIRKMGSGGLSGKPLARRSTEVIQYINQQTNGKMPIIASGGIFSGEDAREKLRAGAALVQVWTGFIYEGPAIAKKICRTILVHQ